MSYFPRERKTIIVENSPVSFALMGAGALHRQVLIRSDDPNLDLVGLDNRTLLSKSETYGQEKLANFAVLLRFGTFTRFSTPDLRPFIVMSSPYSGRPISDEDSRGSYLSFAWRGLATKQDLDQIQNAFSMIAVDLAAALSEETRESAEWQIAPLIAICRRKTDSYVSRAKSTRAALFFTLAVYGVIALTFALNFPFFLGGVKF